MRDEFDDEQDDRDMGYRSSGYRTSSPTSDFSTTLISKDGQFFGVKLSSDMASNLQTFTPLVLDWARRRTEKIGIPWAEKFAEKALHYKDPQKILRFGGKAGAVIGYSTILAPQILGIGRNVYDSIKNLNQLRVAVRPLAKSNSAVSSVSPLSGDNEVVANARGKINGVFWKEFLQTATSTIGAAPNLVIKFREQGAENRIREFDHKVERAGSDSKRIADLYEEEIVVGENKTGDNAKAIRDGGREFIERQRSDYMAEMKAFKEDSANRKSVDKRIEEALAELHPDNIHVPLKALQECGVRDAYQLEQDIRYAQRQYSHDQATAEIEKLIERRKKSFSKNKKHYIDEALTTRYVQQEGAFDRSQEGYLDDRDHDRQTRRKTIKEELEEEIHKLRKGSNKAKEDAKDSKLNSELGKMGANLAAGFVSALVTQKIAGKSLQKFGQPIALDRILHLRRVLEQSQDHPPEQVPAMEGTKDRDMSYVQYVHSIFQQHQKDCRRTEIGQRFTQHFDNARWDDSQIMQLPDEELTAYEYAVKTIAKRIRDGRMDAIALVNLVGDKHNKIVRDDGRSFGPHGAGKDDASVKKAIGKLIDKQSMLLHAKQSQTDEQINDKLGDFIFNVADLKKALESNALESQERAFLFTLFSNVVGSDSKLCQMLGISDSRCQELRQESKESFSVLLDGAVSVLAEIIESGPDEVKKELQLTDKQQELVLALDRKQKETGKGIVDITEDREQNRVIETVVANAIMGLRGRDIADENGKPQRFWQRLVAAARKPKQPQKDAEATEADAAGEMEETAQHRRGGKRQSWGEDISPRDIRRRGEEPEEALSI